MDWGFKTFLHFFLMFAFFFPPVEQTSKLQGCELILSCPVLARKETSSNNLRVITLVGRTSKKLEWRLCVCVCAGGRIFLFPFLLRTLWTTAYPLGTPFSLSGFHVGATSSRKQDFLSPSVALQPVPQCAQPPQPMKQSCEDKSERKCWEKSVLLGWERISLTPQGSGCSGSPVILNVNWFKLKGH